MPNLSFELPHWLYWGSLAIFPLIAMVMARRSKTMSASERTLPIGYFILITGGILGLHRFYMKNLWGFLYLPLFFAILYSNGEQRDARELVSDAANLVKRAESTISRETPRLETARAELPALKAALAEVEAGSLQARRAERRVKRAEDRIQKSEQRLERARADLETSTPALAAAQSELDFWNNVALYAFLGILAFMALDAALLPLLARRANAAPDPHATSSEVEAPPAAAAAEMKDDAAHITKGGVIGAIDRTAFFAGEFVAYWAVIAVMVYYMEVVLRYVFNSPTIWAHEGMFLMFGMQYLIAGSYAMLTESHVRVDIFYAKFSRRTKAFVDVWTSIFFFIYAGTLLVTGYIFAMDATRVNEISVQEWAIPYWPIKWSIFVGALLLALQGVAKLAKDIAILVSGEDPDDPGSNPASAMREAA